METYERRRYNRFAARNDAIVVIPSKSESLYGFLVDISTGGISFEYIPIDNTVVDAKELDIVLDDAGKSFSRLPFKSISDFEISDPYYTPVIMRRRGVQFVDLAEEQRTYLEDFIRKNVLETDQSHQ